MKPLSQKDRKLLMIWAAMLIVGGAYFFWPSSDTPVTIAATAESVDTAEQRLVRLRRLAAAVPAKQDVLKQVSAELALREKGLIRADTGAQAQAQMVQILRQLGTQEDPRIEIRGIQFGPLAPLDGGLSDKYGVVNLTIQVECRIEQLVNFLAGIGARPELLYPQTIEISASNPKDKTLRVSLSVAGVVPRELTLKPGEKGAKAGDRKGGPAF